MIHRLLDSVKLPINDINVFILRRYLAEMEMSGCKRSTIDGIRQVFSAFFKWLTAEELIDKNPCVKLNTIKTERVVRPQFSQIEIDRLRSACTSVRDRAIIEFLRSTGCRIGEIVRLNINDLDLTNLECKVVGKGDKERVVYIDEVCAMWLNNYIATRTEDGALFAGRGSTRVTDDGIRVMLKRLGEKANVANVHPHRFRRTLATQLIAKGMPLQNVAKILGHEKVDTTMRYVNLDRKAIEYEYRKFTA